MSAVAQNGERSMFYRPPPLGGRMGQVNENTGLIHRNTLLDTLTLVLCVSSTRFYRQLYDDVFSNCTLEALSTHIQNTFSNAIHDPKVPLAFKTRYFAYRVFDQRYHKRSTILLLLSANLFDLFHMLLRIQRFATASNDTSKLYS